MRVPVTPRSLQQLQELSTPAAIPGGNMEAYRHIAFDTQTYVAAGSDQLIFFANTNADRSLSNMETAGSFPDPKYFVLYYISADVLLPPSNAADPAAWADMFNIVAGGRPMLSINVSDKTYGTWPLTYCHASGGLAGAGHDMASATATAQQFANNGIFDGGLCLDGALTIPPKVGFGVTIAWGAAVAVAADTLIRVNLDGVIYRRIL